MFSPSYSTAATRRLVDQYVLVALTSILAGVLLILWFHWRGRLDQNLAFAVAAELGIVSVGIVAARRSMVTLHSIEDQLRRVAQTQQSQLDLSPLAQAGSLARGWNVVVDQLLNHQALASLEMHLSEHRGTADDKQWSIVFHSMPEGMAVCDCDEQLLRGNNSLAAMLGFQTVDELIGRSLPELLRSLFAASSAHGNPCQRRRAVARRTVSNCTAVHIQPTEYCASIAFR